MINKYIGFGRDNWCCLLNTPLTFEQLVENADNLDQHYFKHDATNWNGCDNYERTLEITQLMPTGRVIDVKPFIIKGTDCDMGHFYDWQFTVGQIIEVKSIIDI